VLPPFFRRVYRRASVVRQTLTTDRLTLRPSKETILSMCFNAGRPSFTLSMALRDANELSSRLHARLGIRLVMLMLKTVKFICYSIESSLKLRFPPDGGPQPALEGFGRGPIRLTRFYRTTSIPPSLLREIWEEHGLTNQGTCHA
jgi:hypothetical protein